MSKRILVFGDVHGCHVALDAIFRNVDLGPEDLVISLGDVVDRGPGTRQAIDILMNVAMTNELILIRGNHEEMMLNALSGGDMERSWLRYGGIETLESYGGGYENIPPQHVDFLSSSVGFWEGETDICVHASVESGIPLESQQPETLRWTRFTGEERPLESGKRVVCGHTVQQYGLPAVRDGWICIDTFAFGGQFLTCLDITNDLVYQARQDGEFRGPAPLEDVALHM